MKPDKGFTRNDLLIYAGWLAKRWEWSRDLNVSLDEAIANGLRLGDMVKVVGKGKPKPGASSPGIPGNGGAANVPPKPGAPAASEKPGNRWRLFAPKRKSPEGEN